MKGNPPSKMHGVFLAEVITGTSFVASSIIAGSQTAEEAMKVLSRWGTERLEERSRSKRESLVGPIQRTLTVIRSILALFFTFDQ